jgi:hypothetical protein
VDGAGEPVPGAGLYVIAWGEAPVPDLVRAAFANPATHTLVTANAAGEFDIQLAAGRRYYIGPMLDGEPSGFVQELGPEEPGIELEAEFALPAPKLLRGRVQDTESRRLARIPLIVEWQPATLRATPAPMRTTQLLTDESGSFSLPLADPETVTVAIDLERLPEPFIWTGQPQRLTREEILASATHTMVFDLITGVEVTGRVVADGQPVAGARVDLGAVSGVPASFPGGTLTTGPDGRFHFSRLYPGVYVVSAALSGYNTAFLRDLRPRAGEWLTLELQPLGRFRARAIVPPPSPGALVVRARLLGRGQTVELAADQDDTTITLEAANLPVGSSLMVVEATDRANGRVWYAEEQVSVGAGVSNAEVRLEELTSRTARLAGTIPANRQLAARLTREGSTPWSLFPPDFRLADRREPTATIDPDGHMTLANLKTGARYLLEVIDAANGDVLGGAVVDPADREPLRVSIEGTGSIRGRVLSDRGEVCSGVEVILVTGLGTAEGALGTIQERRQTVGFDGFYRFDRVPVGQVRLFLDGDQAEARLIYVPRDRELEINLQCRTLVAIRFAVTTGSASPAIEPGETFLVLPRPGTTPRQRVLELRADNLAARLEPGQYTLTRARTLESRPFDVLPRMEPTVRLDF